MEKINIFDLKNKIKYLENRVHELENEIHKRDCFSKIGSLSSKVDKRTEIIQSLEYLKNKKDKTKQDRDNIYTLEMVLKNIK
jgi:hypothetical protein